MKIIATTIIAITISFQLFSQGKIVITKEDRIYLDRLTYRHKFILVDTILKRGNNFKDQNPVRTIKLVFTNDTNDFLALSTYREPSCKNCKDNKIKSSLDFYSISGSLLWSKTKEGFDVDQCIISDKGKWVNTLWRNKLTGINYFILYNEKGDEIKVIDSVIYLCSSKSGFIGYFERKLKNKWQIGCYDPRYKKFWSTDFGDHAFIKAVANNVNAFVVATKDKIYSFSNFKLIWKKDINIPLGFMDLSDDGKYLLWTSNKENILLIDNKNGQVISNLSQLYEIENESYARFVERSNDIALCQEFNKQCLFVIFDINGKVLSELLIDEPFKGYDFLVVKAGNNYKFYVGGCKIYKEHIKECHRPKIPKKSIFKIKGYKINTDSLPIRRATIIENTEGSDGYNKYDRNAENNTEIKITLSDNREYIGISTYVKPNPYTDLYIGNSTFEAYNSNSQILWTTKKDNYKIDKVLTSNDGQIYYIFWTNVAHSDFRLGIYNSIGQEIFSDDSTQNYVLNPTNLDGKGIYYIRDIGKSNKRLCYYNTNTNQKWSTSLENYASILALSNYNNSIIIYSSEKLYSFTDEKLNWDISFPQGLIDINISYDGFYLLNSYDENKVLLLNNKTLETILDFGKNRELTSLSYAKFVENTYDIAICDRKDGKTRLRIYSKEGNQISEKLYSCDFPYSDFNVQKGFNRNSYSFMVGGVILNK